MNIELKKYQLLPALFFNLLLVLSSCEKNSIKVEPVDPGKLKYDIIGKWIISCSGGGYAGHGTTFNFDIMYLESDNDYRFSRSDTIIEFGSYDFINNVSHIFAGDYKVRFFEKGKIGNGAKPMTAFEMIIQMHSTDSLILCEGSYDGFTYYFKKE